MSGSHCSAVGGISAALRFMGVRWGLSAGVGGVLATFCRICVLAFFWPGVDVFFGGSIVLCCICLCFVVVGFCMGCWVFCRLSGVLLGVILVSLSWVFGCSLSWESGWCFFGFCSGAVGWCGCVVVLLSLLWSIRVVSWVVVLYL